MPDKPPVIDKLKAIFDKLSNEEAIATYNSLGSYLHDRIVSQREKLNAQISQLPNTTIKDEAK